MKRINPSSFSGPRAYFTDFDHRIVTRTSNLQTLKRKGERKLKALLLLKGQIVCAASHLATRFAYEFFEINPILLTSGAIIPAFRSDKTDLSELFARKRFKEKDSAIQFYKDSIQKTVNWNLDDNSMWFRDRFLSDLEDEQSVLRSHISDTYQGILSNLASEIRNGALLGRELIDRLAKDLPRSEKRLLQNYRELLYHMSGARVVNCESALPQENYIDYDLADIKQRRVRLSEEQILSKLFIELIFDSLQRSMLPVELLDLLSFEDIIAIRQPLMSSSFQTKYDQLIKKVVDTYSPDTHKILNIDELEKIRNDLSNTFDEILQKELPRFLKKKAFVQTKQLVSVSSSVALGLAGAVPGVGLVASAISVLKDTPALCVNIGQTYQSMKSISNLDRYYQNKQRLLQKEIEESDISDKATFYEMVDLMLQVISKRIQI
jgi:hypothetical protein